MKRARLFLVGIVLFFSGRAFSSVLNNLYELANILHALDEFDELTKTEGFTVALKDLEETEGAPEPLDKMSNVFNFSTIEAILFAIDDLRTLFFDTSDVFNTDDFLWTKMFREHYREIWEEFLVYEKKATILPRHRDFKFGTEGLPT